MRSTPLPQLSVFSAISCMCARLEVSKLGFYEWGFRSGWHHSEAEE